MTRSILLGVIACAFGAAAPVHAQFTVAPGYDLFETSFAAFDLDGPGPLPPIPFEGVPIGAFDFGPPPNVWPVDPTDTIVRRIDPAIGAGAGSTVTINIEIVALQLVSMIQFDPDGAGPAPLDFYYATLQVGTPSLGTMDITFDDPNGGTFNSVFTVYLDFHAGALNGPIIFQGNKTFFSFDSWWQRAGWGIPDVNFLLNGFDTTEDFFAPEPLHDDGFGSTHAVIAVVTLNLCSPADMTTTGAGVGDPDFGVPDGHVTGADIQYYVNLWVLGCP